MRSRILLVMLLLAAGLGGAGWYWWTRQPKEAVDPDDPLATDAATNTDPTASMTDEQLVELLTLRNRGVAALEDEKWDLARTEMHKIRELLPDDPLSYRNLVVAEVARRGTMPPQEVEARAEALAAARTALVSLQQVDPEGFSTRLLEARVAAAEENTDGAIAALRLAAAIEPENAAVWFEIYSLVEPARRHMPSPAAVEAINNAYARASSNLAVIGQRLRILAMTRDPELAGFIDDCRPLFLELEPDLARRAGRDPVALLDEARLAAERPVDPADAQALTAQWDAVSTSINFFSNVLLASDIWKSDRNRVELHPLEFVASRFAFEAGNERLHNLGAEADEAVAVTWKERSLAGMEPGVVAVATADVDLDTAADLVMLLENRLTIRRRDRVTGEWIVLAELDVPAGYSRVTPAELDQDANSENAPPPPEDVAGRPVHQHTADVDFVLSGAPGVLLVRNELNADGSGRQLVITDPGELATPLRNVSNVAAADVNSDGDIDLLIVADGKLHLWSNRGDATFRDLTDELPELAGVASLCPVDLDRDIDLDVVVGFADGRVELLENLRHGQFRSRAIPEAQLPAGPVAAVDVLDVDRNRSWDLVIAGPSGILLALSRTIQPGEIVFDAGSVIDSQPCDTLCTWDFDNDGWIDLLSRSGDQPRVGRASPRPAGTVFEFAPLDSTAVQSLAIDDLDRDGDLDVAIVAGATVVLRENDGGNANGWLTLGLLAEQIIGTQSSVSGRVNHYGIGSLVEVFAGPHYQPLLVRSQQTHIGLGESATADAVRVMWPNGIPQNLIDPSARQTVCEKQSLKGSCPYLYTWDGEKFVFCTDLLWAAPIGLQDHRGGYVPTRDWEYLLIAGGQLAADAGEYRLSLTEELWEAAYFDHVALLAIDHPANVSVYSNEKVGPPAIAEFQVHTARELRTPARVVNHRGRDLTAETAALDDVFARPFDTRHRQGYTEDSWMEIDLGIAERPRRLKLFLTGWLYPTDTSINIGLADHPSLPGPTPPALLVPNVDGAFEEVVPFTGFVGGKTKTIVFDLGDPFLTDDYRLRLATSMELSWDRIAFTVDEVDAPVTVTPLEMTSARLHHRGVSARLPHPHGGPETCDYSRVTHEPVWPAMSGKFTRYGDVQELLAAADDRQVVMGTGDEILVTFQVPSEPVPEGWTRDFFLHNVGWDKDADLHTTYGQSSGPLPFRGMVSYPYDPAAFPTDPILEADERDYHTREFDLRRLMRWTPGDTSVVH